MRFEIVRFFFVLALATSTALAGCSSLSRFYKREDLKGPVARMGGVWVGSGVSKWPPSGSRLAWVDLRQEGESVELRAPRRRWCSS